MSAVDQMCSFNIDCTNLSAANDNVVSGTIYSCSGTSEVTDRMNA